MQDICVTATRDHNVYASFRPSIATKDAETRSKMNSVQSLATKPEGREMLTDKLHIMNQYRNMKLHESDYCD